jgi:hypothetical protein
VVGSPGDDGSVFWGDDDGALWRVSLATNGSALAQTRLLQSAFGIGYLKKKDGFGAFLATLPDLDGDGHADLGAGYEEFFRLWLLHP